MPDNLNDLVRRTRRVLRASEDQREAEEPAVPPGFAERVSRARQEQPSAATNLILWQRLSYIGAMVACTVAMASALIFRGEAEIQLAADPWMDMPMSSFADEEFENGGAGDR